MSAFMVSDKTINQIVTHLKDDRESASRVRCELQEHFDIDPKMMPEVLGELLFKLNIDGVNSRYGENEAQEFRPLDYKFKYALASRVVALKALQCWKYQCSEGDVVETKLYKIMEDYENALCHAIVRGLPEYENSEWGG